MELNNSQLDQVAGGGGTKKDKNLGDYVTAEQKLKLTKMPDVRLHVLNAEHLLKSELNAPLKRGAFFICNNYLLLPAIMVSEQEKEIPVCADSHV